MYKEDQGLFKPILLLILSGIGILFLVVGLFWGCCALSQVYNVWSAAKDGQAQLAQADYNRQIAVREAAAKMDAATDLAQAEIIRAQGLAKANQILGASLSGPEGEAYLRYLWIQNMGDTKNQVIYVPTEANLPITEAGRAIK